MLRRRFWSGSMAGKVTFVGVCKTPLLAFSPGPPSGAFFARGKRSAHARRLLPTPLNGQQSVAMLHEKAQIGLKGCQRLHGAGRGSTGSAKPSDPPFLFRDGLLRVPYATLGQCKGIVVRHDATAGVGRDTSHREA
jgi:hypothetical protein